jgi:hypothetical protein
MSRWPARRPLVSPQIREALRLLDGDDALVSDFLHGLRQHAANGSDLSDLVVGRRALLMPFDGATRITKRRLHDG